MLIGTECACFGFLAWQLNLLTGWLDHDASGEGVVFRDLLNPA
jgi:hypothetical protein